MSEDLDKSKGDSTPEIQDDEVHESLLAKRLGLEKKQDEPPRVEENDGEVGTIKLKSPFFKRLENFWYHYKWPLIVTVLVVAIMTILLVQCVNKSESDGYILYAGRSIKRTSEGEESSEYDKMVDSFADIIGDYDGDGKSYIAFDTKAYLSSADRAEVEAANKEAIDNGMAPPYEISENLLYQDLQKLEDEFQTGDYFVFLIDPEIYDRYKWFLDPDEKEVSLFSDLTRYLPEDSSVEFYTDAEGNLTTEAIYLRSLDIYDRDGIRGLPEDTLVCFRIRTAFTDGKDYDRAEANIRALLGYTK